MQCQEPADAVVSAGSSFKTVVLLPHHSMAGSRRILMEENTEDRREVDALCRECGHAFKAFVDRVAFPGGADPAERLQTECPVCGCGDCRIGR
jgi:hypothetical protein